MLDSNICGDCTPVTWANQRRLVSATLGLKEVYPSLDQVIQLYKTQYPDFDLKGSKETNSAQLFK